jgi:hypothetical protein
LSSISNLEKVPPIEGEQVAQIAAGTEHSALVTGKEAIPEPESGPIHKILSELG